MNTFAGLRGLRAGVGGGGAWVPKLLCVRYWLEETCGSFYYCAVDGDMSTYVHLWIDLVLPLVAAAAAAFMHETKNDPVTFCRT